MDQNVQPTHFSRKPHYQNASLYLLLSFLSGVLETGAVTAGVKSAGLTLGIAFALAYQVGCLVRNPLGLTLRGTLYLLFCTLPFLLVLLSGQQIVWALIILTALTSGSIQSGRDHLQPKQPPIAEKTKRLIRVSGFICGIMCGYLTGFVLIPCLISVIIIISMVRPVPQQGASEIFHFNSGCRMNKHGLIMMIHQIHYFTYAYVLLGTLLLAKSIIPQMNDIIVPFMASLYFASGWFTYISGKVVLKQAMKLTPRKSVLLGHAWVVCCLLCMYLFHNHLVIVIIAWVLGGLGGGSVYAIKELAGDAVNKESMELWENLGHVAGVSLSIVALSIFPYHYEFAYGLAMVAALLAFMIVAART